MNLIIVIVILSCIIVFLFSVIAAMICTCEMYKEKIDKMQEPLNPPVKSWVDAYYEKL